MTEGYRVSLLAALMASVSAPAWAEEAGQGAWTGEGELGYTRTTGNTDTQSLFAKLGLAREAGKWRSSFAVEAVQKSERDVATAERYYVAAKLDYRLTERSYVFSAADYEDDRFSGFRYRANLSGGYGRRLLATPKWTLALEAGPGVRFSELDTGESDREATVRLAASLGWRISPTAKLSEEASAVVGEDGTVYRSLTAVTAKINSVLALRVSYLYKHATEVPAAVEETDTETAVTLVYGF